jgi:hypothetical protein
MQRTLIVFSLFFAVALAGNSYTYLTYFSDSNCENFVATRGLTDENGPFSAVENASSCQESMQCLLNPASSQCRDIATSDRTIRMEGADDDDEFVEQYVNDVVIPFELGVCAQSGAFPLCHRAYFSTEQIEQVV